MSIALGLTLVFGALLPSAFVSMAPSVFEPLFPGTPRFGILLSTSSGLATLLGVVVCLLGIGLTGKAGMMKDGELSTEQKQEGVKEFDFKKGVLVAIFSGLMSAAFAMGVAAGKPLASIAHAHGANTLFINNHLVYLSDVEKQNFWKFENAASCKKLSFVRYCRNIVVFTNVFLRYG
jgi:L-rhamnose-H+ transport protein